MSGTQSNDSPFPSTSGITTQSHPLKLGRQSIIWIVVAGVIVAVGFSVTLWLLCSCCRNRKRRAERTRVLDDRNQFHAWNPAAPDRGDPFADPRELRDGFELTPLAKAAVKPGHSRGHSTALEDGSAHPGEPVVVDESVEPPVYGRNEKQGSSSRYYASLASPGWNFRESAKRFSMRVSQIGRAY